MPSLSYLLTSLWLIMTLWDLDWPIFLRLKSIIVSVHWKIRKRRRRKKKENHICIEGERKHIIGQIWKFSWCSKNWLDIVYRNDRPRSTRRFANASSSVASSNVPLRFLLQAKKTNDETSNRLNISHAIM